MSLFGRLPASAFSMGQMPMDQPEEEAPRPRRRGLFGGIGRGLRDGSALDRLLIAQAIMSGDIGQAAQLRGRMQQQRAAREEAEREAAVEEARYQAGATALARSGIPKDVIAGMTPSDFSTAVRMNGAPGPTNEQQVFDWRSGLPEIGRAGAVTGIRNSIDPVIQADMNNDGIPETTTRSAWEAQVARQGGQAPPQQPSAPPGATAAQINAEADAAIQAGRDPALVNQRRQQLLQQMQGGPTPQASGNFPPGQW